MTPSASNPFWNLIDGVLVINLAQRTDRWAAFQAATCDIIPPEKLQRLPARWGRDIPGFGQRPWFRGGKRDATWAGRAGCLLSHRQALLKAREANWQTVLILEDDVTFAPDFSTLTDLLAAGLKEHDWQVCYLGFTDPWAPSRKLAALGEPHALYQVHGCNTAHAYLVRETARDWILHQLPDEANVWTWLATHRAVDRWYQRQLGLHFPVTCVSPSVVNQVAGLSDIVAQPAHYAADDGHVRAVRSAAAGAAYYLRHALRRSSIQLGLVGDILRGQAKRINGL
jgi:glycosyl transferase family 25